MIVELVEGPITAELVDGNGLTADGYDGEGAGIIGTPVIDGVVGTTLLGELGNTGAEAEGLRLLGGAAIVGGADIEGPAWNAAGLTPEFKVDGAPSSRGTTAASASFDAIAALTGRKTRPSE